MKTIILYVSIVSILTAAAQAQNANVTWQTPVTISGASDVNTEGTYYGSWAPYNQTAVNDGGLTVNGVTFQAYSDLGISTTGANSGYNDYADPNTANANYNNLMETATYNGNGNGVLTVTWNDTPGQIYLIQAWANDGRGNGRSETFTGGANTSATLVFGNFPGQYIIGTYVADASGTETITLDGSASTNGDYPQINLLQVRNISAVPAVTNYQSAVLADNPLAYYALSPASDPAGTSPDLTGNGNDGSTFNVAAASGPSRYITNAANFNGSGFDDLSEGANAGLLNFAGPVTLEAWVEPASSSEFADIVAKGWDATSGDEIALRVNGAMYGSDYFGTSGSQSAAGGTQTTNWTYVVLASDGRTCSLYINGSLVAQNPDYSGSVNFSDDWVIGDGSSGGNSRYFNGNISEVAIYNHGLTTAQIQSHYYFGMAGTNNLNYAVPIITNQPQAEAAYPGGTATFSVGVLSALPTTNQWYTNNIPIIGQTGASLTLNNVESSNVANYSVVVGNSNGTTTSVSVGFTLLPPGILEWSSNNNNAVWDTDTTANWLDLTNDQQTVFNTGNQVLFDDTVGVPTSVTVNGIVSPGIMTVDSSTNNFNISSGTINGSGSLIKEGSSTLTISSSGGLTGPVTISGGAIQAENNCLDSVSSITITNNSTLDLEGGAFSASKPIIVSGTGLDGEDAIYNSYNDDPDESVDITLAGDTKFGGSERWDLASGSQISGAHNLTIDWSAGAGYGQWNTVTIGSNVSGIFLTNSEITTNGSDIGMSYMDTSFQNPGTVVTVGTNCQMLFYNGGFNGSIHVLSGGTVFIYTAPDAFNGSNLVFENGAAWESYYNTGANTPINSAVTLNGVAHFVVGDHDMIYSNVIGGAGGFVMDYFNNGMVLSAANTYSGPTIIGSSGSSPEVILTGNGSISKSSLIFFGGDDLTVQHLDVSGRSDQTLTLASGQTLAGIGGITGSLVVSPGATLSPSGSNTTIGITTGANSTGTIAASGAVTLNGTTVLKLNGSGVNDEVQAGETVTYGGTLSLVNISGAPLAAGNSFQIFSAGSYAGSFSSITPATPGPGLVWGTSQLNIGFLNVVAATSEPAISSVTESAGNLVFSGTNGTASGTYYVLTTTNLATTNWVRLTTNSFGANGSFSVTNAISAGTPARFYRIESSP